MKRVADDDQGLPDFAKVLKTAKANIYSGIGLARLGLVREGARASIEIVQNTVEESFQILEKWADETLTRQQHKYHKLLDEDEPDDNFQDQAKAETLHKQRPFDDSRASSSVDGKALGTKLTTRMMLEQDQGGQNDQEDTEGTQPQW